MTQSDRPLKLTAAELRWQCPPQDLPFETTADVAGEVDVLGQPTARDALRFAIDCRAHGQNVYVRGPRGTGRFTMVRSMLDRLQPVADNKRDRCYVHNFTQPDRPRLISLPAGQARRFRRRLREFAAYIETDLLKALDAEPLVSQRSAVQKEIETRVGTITAPLEAELRRAGMALVPIQSGPVTQTAIFPLVEGKPVAPQQFHSLVEQEQVPAARAEEFERDYPKFQKRLHTISREVGEAYRDGAEQIRKLNEQTARALLGRVTESIRSQFDVRAVGVFLDEIVEDVVEHRLAGEATPGDPASRYGVNILVEHCDDGRAPVVEETTPSLISLLGTVEARWSAQGPAPADYRGISAGALLRADGGYLVLDAADALIEPGAWRALMRALRTGKLEIVPPEVGWLQPSLFVKPEPIDIRVRVILVGDARTYYLLDAHDTDFKDLFKVLADFDTELERSAEGCRQFAAVIARIAREEQLLAFHRDAVAALVEHGARIVARAGKLTANFGRIADIAREASFVAGAEDAAVVRAGQVAEAVRRTKARASLPSRRFQELVHSGVIRIQTTGAVAGQINGLAVIHSGPLTYGFPARITATIGAGQAGLINIERQAELSGAIHTKGFYILGGLLRHLLKVDHPLAFSASIAFEQSYGGIDGDSASAAETCCLLSALTDVAIRQDLAITGAIDQLGHVQAIGGVNEKIEGFYDTCCYFGLTGEQGVIIPLANAGDLMLRPDVVAACVQGEFCVYAVERIEQALELLTGTSAGRLTDGAFPPGTLLRRAVERALEFWGNTSKSPAIANAAAGAPQ